MYAILPINFVAGVNIERACEEAVKLANRMEVNFEFSFNGICIFVTPNCYSGRLVEYYYEQLKKETLKCA